MTAADRLIHRYGWRSWRWARRISLRVRTGSRPSALVVNVPEAEAAVGSIRAAHDLGSRFGIPAHITVLAPFLASRRRTPSVTAQLAAICSSTAIFDFRLTSVRRFPGVTYLAPAEPQPFVDLTERVWATWPECPPFGGVFPQIVPHLTLAEGLHDAGQIRHAVLPALPIDATARGVTLLCQQSDGWWRPDHFFPFGAQ